MSQLMEELRVDACIEASWQRCQTQHRLLRNAAKPVLRLQSSEVTPRLDEVVERTGGRLGIFSELSRLATDAGHCLVVTDAEGVVVRFESQSFNKEAFESNGIGLGSCWDERIAGTNGVSVAMAAGDVVTVRGEQHFHKCLTQFACTAVPILDADNQSIGAVSLSAFDRGSTTDYLIARKLLLSAVGKIQSQLFETKFSGSTILSVYQTDKAALFRQNGLVAVDDAGRILSATSTACALVGAPTQTELVGRSFASVFGHEADASGRGGPPVVTRPPGAGKPLRIAVHSHSGGGRLFPGWQPATRDLAPARGPRRLAPAFRDLSLGSQLMARNCARVEGHLRHAHPVVIEGETGTGKSALVEAVQTLLSLSRAQVITVDCATLSDSREDRAFLDSLWGQARAVLSLGTAQQGASLLVLDNVDALPDWAQPGLRSVLEEVERAAAPLDTEARDDGVRIVALSRNSLYDAVVAGRLRDDLYHLLAGASVRLPALRNREGFAEIAEALSTRIAGADVRITPEAMQMLAAHPWPGNLRELRNTLQQALINGNGTRISPVDLPPMRSVSGPHRGGGDVDRHLQAGAGRPYDEKTMLEDALTSTLWNVSEAARVLGIGRATIHRKIKHYNLARPS